MSRKRSPVHEAELKRLYKLRDEAMLRAALSRRTCPLSHEWATLTLEFRMVVLLMAGIDGEIQAVARKDWREFPLVEQESCRSVMRSMRRQLQGVSALIRR
jgi:hypothetical protein